MTGMKFSKISVFKYQIKYKCNTLSILLHLSARLFYPQNKGTFINKEVKNAKTHITAR